MHLDVGVGGTVSHWRNLIEKDYLGSWDILGEDGKSRDIVVEIAKVESRSLKTRENPKGKRKAVIVFKDTTKPMVANTTNCETLERMYGPDVRAWVGQKITLYVARVRNPKGGDPIPGIRVKSKKPDAAAPATGIVGKPVNEELRERQDEAFDREPGQEG